MVEAEAAATGTYGGGPGAGDGYSLGPSGADATLDVPSILRWAQDVAKIREDALADVGLGWPQMRRMLRGIGPSACGSRGD